MVACNGVVVMVTQTVDFESPGATVVMIGIANLAAAT
jgi:hypothetical protein